jgi:hypothetical protein
MSKTIEVSFKKRTAAQLIAGIKLDSPDVATVTTTYDYSNLTEEEILQWAQRGVTIHIQSKIKSGALTEDDLANKTYSVPSPGERKRLTVKDNIRRLVAKSLGVPVEDVTDDMLMEVMGSLV